MMVRFLCMLVVLSFLDQNPSAQFTSTQNSVPSPNVPTTSGDFQPITYNHEFRGQAELSKRLVEMINQLQGWSTDVSHISTHSGIGGTGSKIQRFLCYYDIFCKELLHIKNSERHLDNPNEEQSELYRIYLPVGFLNPLPVQETEEMYAALNRDRSYRSSVNPLTAKESPLSEDRKPHVL
ncbi:uncharacterized protein LOC134229681 [Saccostrea cucullata]|uniref:uncharacterized protein LOC134229681 n=1 Tax=Saccostrea cuccullata TaxID=36930 RepID=UPI002ED3986B